MTWLDDLAAHSRQALDERARDSLAMRGVSDAQIDLYRIGYIDRALPPADYPQDFLKWSHHGAKLDDSYVFPLTNVLGDIRGFQFRHVDKDVKGYNDYIADKTECVLFGLAEAMDHIWKTEGIWVVEGNFDLFPVQRHYPGVVATLTNRIVTPLLRIMRRMVRDVWLGYDMDSKGRGACTNFVKLEGKNFQCHEVRYPVPRGQDGKLAKDPNEMWEILGDASVGEFIRTTVSAV